MTSSTLRVCIAHTLIFLTRSSLSLFFFDEGGYDKETGYNPPTLAEYTWNGKTVDGQPFSASIFAFFFFVCVCVYVYVCLFV
jgi:hypothetical protein